ncbi:hypothetical protein OG394_25130 [Kribbella sp. NBC_01245]|uniref:hypothetical protein n=1 Tax=Kribbella sp. NBC_01245 TaxID=2903578 RepID=UPI002E28C1A3|nr:hypothetical protein [Kribbella sp. NBC_01245]
MNNDDVQAGPAQADVQAATPAAGGQAAPEVVHAQAATDQIPANAETLSPVFKLVFLSVFGITVGALLINVALVMILDEPTAQAASLIETCSTMAKAGFGAIIGLIGGKALPS